MLILNSEAYETRLAPRVREKVDASFELKGPCAHDLLLSMNKRLRQNAKYKWLHPQIYSKATALPPLEQLRVLWRHKLTSVFGNKAFLLGKLR